MNKLDKFKPKQVQLNFISKESWLKTRIKVKESKCENCGKLHADCDGEIALATFKDRINAHVCEECGNYLMSKGAVDILKLRELNMDKKSKLIKQAERVGISFDTWYDKNKAEDYTILELREKIAKYIKHERSRFHEFLKYPHLAILKEFVDAYNVYSDYKLTYFEAFRITPDILYDYDTDDNYEHHRWCSYFDATIKLGNKTFSYTWANANGDNSLEDAGFDVNNVWETMSVVVPEITIDYKAESHLCQGRILSYSQTLSGEEKVKFDEYFEISKQTYGKIE